MSKGGNCAKGGVLLDCLREERLRRTLALLDRSKSGLNAFGELLATLPLNPLHELLHPATGMDPEADGLLCHPTPNQSSWMLAVVAELTLVAFR